MGAPQKSTALESVGHRGHARRERCTGQEPSRREHHDARPLERGGVGSPAQATPLWDQPPNVALLPTSAGEHRGSRPSVTFADWSPRAGDDAACGRTRALDNTHAPRR